MPNSNVMEVLKGCVGMTTTVPHTYIFINIFIVKVVRSDKRGRGLPLFYRLLLSDVDCVVELRCHVVTRLPFGRER